MDQDKNKDAGKKIISLVSHKLRTPVSVITGYSEAILMQGEKGRSPFTQKAFEEIYKQGLKVAGLVDKLLTYNKADAMTPDAVKKVRFGLKELLEEVKKEVQPRHAETGKSDVEIICAPDLFVDADRELFKTAVTELLDNALLFNNRMGKIIKINSSKSTAYTSVSIKDNGSGISPQDVNNIFEPFFQVDDFFTGQVEGWGLGLPMVKKIMDLHKGSVSVVTDKGLGSIFTITVPD